MCPGSLSERHSVLTKVRKTEKEEGGGQESGRVFGRSWNLRQEWSVVWQGRSYT